MAERSQLWVEGTDDDHTIRHLLIRHGVEYDQKPWPAKVPSIEQAGDKEQLLRTVKLGISASSGRAVGFVLDADSSLRDCWQSILSRLREAGVDAPQDVPHEGFVGESRAYNTRVGVWLMPDNQQGGALENFLSTLIEEENQLLCHAQASTIQAKNGHGANFRDVDKNKAVLHAWLAWQEVPGLPYGTAMKARYFRQDSPVAERFVAWFRHVFQLQ